MDEKQINTLFERAKRLYKSNEFNESLKLFKDLINDDLENYIRYANYISAMLLEQGKFKEAMIHVDEILKRNPNYVVGHFNKMIICIREGKIDKARLELEELPKYDKDNRYTPKLQTIREDIVNIAINNIILIKEQIETGFITGKSLSEIKRSISAIIAEKMKSCDLVIRSSGTKEYSMMGEKHNYLVGITDDDVFYVKLNDIKGELIDNEIIFSRNISLL